MASETRTHPSLIQRHLRTSVSILFLAAFLARLAFVDVFVGFHHDRLEGDERGYVTLARKLSEGQEYSDGVWGKMWRTPGYPLLLSAVFRIFGYDLASVRILHALLGGLTCVLAFLVGRRVFNHQALGLLAAIYLAFYPPHVWISGQMLSENLLMPLLLTIPLLFMSEVALPRLWKSLVCGALLGGAILVRPESGGIVVPLLVLLMIFQPSSLKQRCSSALLILLSVLLVITPWILRNYTVSGRFVISTVGGEAFWGGNNEAILIDPKWKGYWKLPDDLSPVLAHSNELDRDRMRWKLGLDFLKTHRSEIPRLAFYKLLRFYNFMLQDQALRAVMLVSFGMLLPFVFLGFFLSFFRFVRDRWPGLIAHGIVIYYNLIAIAFWGSNRFRLVIDPFLIMFGIWVILEMAKVLRTSTTRASTASSLQ